MKYFYLFFLIILISCNHQKIEVQKKSNFNNDWSFVIQDTTLSISSTYDELVKVKWDSVQLPHTPKIEPQIVNNQWQGICWYKKDFQLSKESKTQKHFIHFEGAMNIAEVWVNGQKLITHQGGYLPFTVDFTAVAKFDEPNQIIVKLNNFDNPTTGPKPLQTLDFNTYGGLYRNVWLISKNKLYITDPILENKTASGGVFVNYENVSDEKATIHIKTHIKNEFDKDKIFQIKQILLKDGKEITSTVTNDVNLKSQNSKQFSTSLSVKNPELWSPSSPNLYQLKTQVLFDDQLVDEEQTTIGIKTMEFKGQDFYLNGKKTFLRGVNRHQEYPFVGYALSDNANYRDAQKIKDAGFDYVRLSHYPQSEAFMKACDELGLVTINAILGWQYFSEDEKFQKHVFQTARDLIRRDRNKASVIAWEVSLNESWMPEYFIDSLTNIAKKEYPTNQGFTAGWQSYSYDIYLQARQHRLQHYDPKIKKPYNVSEYGDWEYYAMNAGLNQDSWGNLLQEERSSRQLRTAGEKGLLQQALNIQEAHNDNLQTPAFADGYWVMYDYNRGYANDLEASGIMDIFRLSKFAYYFYQSQREANHPQGKPMIFIANYWDIKSDLNVKVFSNCDEVELFLNDKSLGKEQPDKDRISSHINQPPFTFNIAKFEKGTLIAKGYIDGKEVATHQISTVNEPKNIEIVAEKPFEYNSSELYDIIYVYAKVVDENGTLLHNFNESLVVGVNNASILNPEPIKCEAGIATILLKVPNHQKNVELKCASKKHNIFIKYHIPNNKS